MTESIRHLRPAGPPGLPLWGRIALRPLLLVLAIGLGGAWPGCGALLLVGGAGTSAIAFATGELRVTEEVGIEALTEATRSAIETLRYQEVDIEREPEQVRWTAQTAGGDPVDIRLAARGTERTELRIRIGVFGSEPRSRLVLEQIRQAL